MRKILLAFTLLILTACTPAQALWHQMMKDKIAAIQDPLVRAQTQTEYDFWVKSYEEERAKYTEGHPCAEWFDLAIEAGFTPDQWVSPMSRIMNAESGCNPDAHNPSGATGLMQVMPMWIDDCGFGNLRDPAFNINCAYHVWTVQGWPAWSTY